MINAVLVFVAAGGACSLIGYALTNRAAHARRPWRQSTGDSFSIGPSDGSSGGGWSRFSWFGGDSSSQDSNSSSDFGGDSGGGDGGGGGGGD
jgi:hypothetical protein